MDTIWVVVVIAIVLVCIAGWMMAAWYFCILPPNQEFIGEAEFEGGHKRGTFVKQKPLAKAAIDSVKY